MEQAKKITVGIISLMLISSIAVFVFLLQSYAVPVKETPKSMQAENEQREVEKENINAPDETVGENLPTNTAPQTAPLSAEKIVINQGDPEVKTGNILITIEDSKGKKLSNIECALQTGSKDHSGMITLFSKKSDKNGQCYFYDLDTANPYVVQVYWTKDKSVLAHISLSWIEPGKTTSRVVIKN